MDLKMEEIPAICREIITMSTELSLIPSKEDRGGYKVHPEPAPRLIIDLNSNSTNLYGISQKAKLFSRGKIKSGVIK